MSEGKPETTIPKSAPGTSGGILAPGYTFTTLTDKLASIALSRRTPFVWFIGAGVGFALTMVLLGSLSYLLVKGIGIWGVNQPVGWGFEIVNFVWWIGIGHAGTLISAILLLLRQPWRNSINRFAEAMTIFAVACAGIYPAFHTGRPWLDYWLFPYPNTMGMWPNFRSPLIWDVFAVSTYATVSLLFWYVGMIPDSGDAARPRQEAPRQGHLRDARDGLAGIGAALAAIRDGLAAAGGARDAAGRVGAHGRVLRLRRRASCRDGTPRSSRPTSWPARSTPGSRWCSRWRFRCGRSTASRTSSR